MLTLTITPADHCRPVESLLRKLLPTATAGYLHQLLRSGHLLVGGAPATADRPLRLGDTVTLKESGRTRALLATAPPALDILGEDEQIVVVNKAPGLPVHRTAEAEDDLVTLGERFMAERGTPVKLRPVNRLDRGTSGATVLAKSSTSAGMFGRMVKETGFTKLYLAVVTGTPEQEMTVTEPLDGKEAETRLRVLHQGRNAALLSVVPVTGRMHQIRQHLTLIGHPVLGDRRYRGPALADYPGHLLHSFRLGFRHPATGRQIQLLAPLPAGFLAHLERLAGAAFTEILRILPDLS
jgi:23S rRNA pseudouridine955/2504/2580 synthase